MENQEQNSKSEDIQKTTEVVYEGKETARQIVVEALATPYRALIPVTQEDLRPKFDEFWKEYGHLIADKYGYKGKKGKGGQIDLQKAQTSLETSVGHSKLYDQVIASWATDAINEQYKSLNDQVLYVSNVKIDGWESDDAYVVAFFYFWPKLTFKGGIDFEVKRQVPRDLDKAIEGRLKDLQNQYKEYTPVTEDLTEEMEVLVDIIASLNNEPYQEGTVRKQWFQIKEIISGELKLEIIKHKVGDLFEVEFVNPFKPITEGEEPEILTAAVKIYDARLGRLREQDDIELYKAANFESKEAFIEKFTQEYNDYMDRAEQQLAFDHVMDQLTMQGSLEAIPQAWINLNTDHFVSNHIKQAGDIQKAMKMVGAPTQNKYKQMFEGKVLKDTINRMAVQAYANRYGLELEPKLIMDHIMTQVEWVDLSE